MGILVEFNPDLALRDIRAARDGKRKPEECIPEPLSTGQTYPFLKEGQRNYWLHGDIPLLKTKGNQNLSRPIASIRILEATHVLIHDTVYTKGTYLVTDVFTDSDVHFDGFTKRGV